MKQKRKPLLKIALAIQSGREGGVVEGARSSIHSPVGLHSRYTILGLVGWQLASKYIGRDERLIVGQHSERLDDLVGRILVAGVPGHKVHERVEGDVGRVVGVH